MTGKRAFLIWASLAAISATPLAAQEGPWLTIESFRGFDWGASTDAIVAALGDPEEDAVLDGGLRMMAFRDSLIGDPSVILFGFLPDEGLVKGQEVVNAGEGQDCVDRIRGIHKFVNLQYPLVRPSEEARNNTGEMICEAALAGSGHWHRQWIDEETGAVISVRLDPGSGQVNLVYESLRFREWAGAPLEVVPDEGAVVDEHLNPLP